MIANSCPPHKKIAGDLTLLASRVKPTKDEPEKMMITESRGYIAIFSGHARRSMNLSQFGASQEYSATD